MLLCEAGCRLSAVTVKYLHEVRTPCHCLQKSHASRSSTPTQNMLRAPDGVKPPRQKPYA